MHHLHFTTEYSNSPALVALENVLSAVAADAGVGRHRSTAAWALQGLGGRGQVVVEVGILDHDVGCDNGEGEFQLEFCLSGCQHTFLGFVPNGGSEIYVT